MEKEATRDGGRGRPGPAELELARKLFEEGWSGGQPESPLQFLTDDVVMRDIAAHAGPMRGHAAVVEFFGPMAPFLKVWPEEYFVSDDGVALTWMAYIHITNDHQGKENRGKWLCCEGMSRLEFRDRLVSVEIDYWHGGQGICDDATAHFQARRALSRAELGATTGSGDGQ
ncbi:MAG: nuclear transport factor 2 family protein [Deltaproteobacteria bacterium]|nr:nuclear transport factor 2 family protein [Deltaproteobacteria bacterium]